MTSLDIRSNSAVMKRVEQLKRWEESDTNRQSPTPRPEHGRKIKFSSGCVFLASCLSGDKEEVIKLLENGADINTANVDGLTALHQACIDDNLDMVEFLVENGADINRQDNEGWTPLHATASCGFVSIARFLVENGADVSAVNSDGDLALDLAIDIPNLPMIEYMQKVVNEHKVDCEKARQAEEQMMLADAKKWLRSDASEVDRPHAKTGATALHVAAAKGYTKVISLLLAGHANVDKQDNDGWTPLHAAAHWGQKEAAEMLIDAMADIDLRNYAGQTCIDVADRKMVKFLEELRASNKRIQRRPSSQIRISDAMDNLRDNTSPKLIRVEVKSDHNKDHANEIPVQDGINAGTEPSDVILRRTQSFESDEKKPISPQRSALSVNLGSNVSAKMSGTTTLGNTIAAAATTTTTTTLTSSATTPLNASSISTTTTTTTVTPIRSNPAPIAESVVVTKPKISAGTIFKNFFKSFVPPTRDEESETQRKAHAKRVRETRRSTQGVTLDEIKSAEELVKKKNSSVNNNSNNNNSNNNNNINVNNNNSNDSSNSNTINNNNKINNKLNTFKLEDASTDTTFPPNNSTIIPSAPAVIAAANLSSSVAQRLIKTAGSNSTDNDKENENRSPLATQAVIQRRRKPKRRSTGVVHIDMEDLDPERQDSVNEGEEKESGSERASRSRLGSTTNSVTGSSNAATSVTDDDKKIRDNAENGETIDYKVLWEAAKLENDKLKQQLLKKDDEIVQSKATIERITNATTKNSLSELEKRERRAMERKLSEMEEELKQLEVYKAENQRLKEENGALIRVISKLSK